MSFDAKLPALRQFMYEHRERLPLFAVYDHPRDMPDYFVARLWVSLPAPVASYIVIYDTSLRRLRETLEALGLIHLDRSQPDDPAILEIWL